MVAGSDAEYKEKGRGMELGKIKRGGSSQSPDHLTREARTGLRVKLISLPYGQSHCALHKELGKLNKAALCGQSRILVQGKTLYERQRGR